MEQVRRRLVNALRRRILTGLGEAGSHADSRWKSRKEGSAMGGATPTLVLDSRVDKEHSCYRTIRPIAGQGIVPARSMSPS